MQEQCCWPAKQIGAEMGVQFLCKDEGLSSLRTDHSHNVLTFGNHVTLIWLLLGQGKPSLDQLLP